jgi:hypothetical protein
LVRSTPENARILVATLDEFGRVPARIDLLTSISGVGSEEAFAGKVSADLDGIPVFVLGKDALIKNKRAVGRPQDLADIDMLEN